MDYAKELLGLFIDVPWSAWAGYADGSGYESGILWRYQARTVGRFGTLGEFVIRFPDEAEGVDIAMSWEDVFGEQRRSRY